jgi:hypothetical protein
MKTMHSLMTFGECAAGHKLRFVTNEKKRRKVALKYGNDTTGVKVVKGVRSKQPARKPRGTGKLA